jgi:hypothetical protein
MSAIFTLFWHWAFQGNNTVKYEDLNTVELLECLDNQAFVLAVDVVI